MKRSVVGWVVATVVVLGVGALAWLWFAGGSGEPSAELTTPTLASPASTTLPAEPGSSTTEPTDLQKTFVIDSAQSSASFEIDEELRGEPTHVVGVTDQVAGQVQVDLADLASAQFSEIVVNARTFRTDAERRDRAIRGPIILNSAADEHEFISFSVISVDGLGGAVEAGETVQFSISGDLTIRGNTNPVAFQAEVTLVDENTIEGKATADVFRSDFDIGIPSIPSVANVTDEVVLNVEFVAISN